MKIDEWIEQGWYDCCSGWWFVSYTLYSDDGDMTLSFNDERDIDLHYYAISEGHTQESNEYLDIMGYLDSSKYDDFVIPSKKLEKIRSLYKIDRDLTIDYDEDYRCDE